MYQTADLEVVEGDSSTLHCCWTGAHHTQYRADWLKNEVKITHQLTALTSNWEGCGLDLSPVNNGTCSCVNLTLLNVTRNHTGRFVCKVIMNRPILIQFRGSGTMIIVRERRNPTTQESMFSLPQSLVLFLFQTKSIFSLLRYQSLVFYSNIKYDRIGWSFEFFNTRLNLSLNKSLCLMTMY